MANFGVDLLFESQKTNIADYNDVLMIVVHWMLCKNNFRCVGVGHDKVFSEEDRASELLPEGWNQNRSLYTIRYTLNKQIYILYGVVSEGILLINFLDVKTLKTTNLAFEVKQIVKSKTGSTLDDYVNDSETVIKRMSEEIVKPILDQSNPKGKREEETSNIRYPRPVHPPQYHDESHNPLRDPLRNVGRGDLDPFGRGGGMIFQPDMPFAPGGFGPLGPLPGPGRMGIPPGARFDPINPNRRLDPDNDHLPPPPGYDDMFM